MSKKNWKRAIAGVCALAALVCSGGGYLEEALAAEPRQVVGGIAHGDVERGLSRLVGGELADVVRAGGDGRSIAADEKGTDVLWYCDWYYEVFDADSGESRFARGARGQGDWAESEDTVRINPDDKSGEGMGWSDPWGDEEVWGTHYVFDAENPANRLEALAKDASKANPLKAYFKLAPATLKYEFDETAPAGAKVPKAEQSAYSKSVQVTQPAQVPGYRFDGWKVKNPQPDKPVDLDADGTRITMPYWDITLVGSWTKLLEPVRGQVRITPADMIVYMGGEGGYDGIVDGNGDIVAGGLLPAPGVRIDLPSELVGVDPMELELVSEVEGADELCWSFEKYGPGLHDVYRIAVPSGSDQRPARVQFVDAAGNVVTNDAFDPVVHLNQTLTMRLYAEGLSDGKVYVRYRGMKFPLNIGEGSLAVRELTPHVIYDRLFEGGPVQDGDPFGWVPDGTVFYVNDSNVEVAPNDSDLVLLFDEIIDGPEGKRAAALRERGDAFLREQGDVARHSYEFKYLDVVDRANANAWVTPSESVRVSWPVPQEALGKKIRVLHFKDLHRNTGDGSYESITACEVEEIPTRVQDGYVMFEAREFSPFAIVWETTDAPIDPEQPEQPEGPTDPDSRPPFDPDEPLEPEKPERPVEPVLPTDLDQGSSGAAGDDALGHTPHGEVASPEAAGLPATGDERTAHIGILVVTALFLVVAGLVAGNRRNRTSS